MREATLEECYDAALEGTPAPIERPHAKLGGSSASRWVQCQGSVFLEQDLPPQEGTVHTDAGTLAHEVAEHELNKFLQFQISGLELEDKYTGLVTSEMIEHAENYVQALWENALEKSITGKFYDIEDTFTVSKEFDMWGYTDFWCYYIDDRAKRVGVIADYKYGYHDVKVSKNAQLAFYAVGMQEEWTAKGAELDYVKAIIYQPRSGGEAYKETTFTAAQLKTWKKKFLAAGKQIFIKQKPKFKTGEWCQYCRAQVSCKKYSNEIISKTDLALIDKDLALPDVEKVSDEAIANIVLNADGLEKFIKECKKYATRRFINGHPIPGTKVISTNGKRGWIKGNEEKIGEELAYYIDDPFNKKLKGIGEIERELKKELKKDEIESFMAKHTVKSQGTLHLVSEEDPRKAVSTTSDLLLEIEEDE